MSEELITKRILMAKKLARKWLEENSSAEYRLTIYENIERNKINLPSVLRAMKTKRSKWASVGPVPDMIVKVGFDFVVVRSKDEDSITRLDSFLRDQGYETFGVF